MTVLSELSKIAYIGSSSQTLYPIPFEYINTDDVKVSIYTSNNEFVEDWTYSVQYVIEGGNVKVLSGYNIDNTKKLLILRMVDLVQDNKYREGGDFPAKSTETSFDKLTMITQQLQETLDRCVKVEVLDNQTPEELLQTVYDKLDSATVIAGDAINAANQAQTAADNATAAVNSAEQTLVQTQAYVDSAKVDINNTKNTAINTINSTVSTAKGDITNTANNATSNITSTVTQAKTDINTAVSNAESNISTIVSDAEGSITSIAVTEANKAIANAAQEATDIAVAKLQPYVNQAQEDANSAAASMEQAALSATAASADAVNAAESAGLAANSASEASIHNFKNKITNCITEIPQDIKLELNNGVLTLKAGSKVYVPNGSGGFEAVITTYDKSQKPNYNANCLCFPVTSDGLANHARNLCFSGTTQPTSGQVWLNTNTMQFYVSSDNGVTWNLRNDYCLPIAETIATSGTGITSIDQVFNGFGYIGSTVFALPGVKGLIPNGRNADGSLKNTEFITNSVLTHTDTGATSNYICLGIDKDFFNPYYEQESQPNTRGLWYNPKTNLLKRSTDNGVTWVNRREFYCAKYSTDSSGRVTSLTSKTAFHAVDWNDFEKEVNTKQDISNLSQTIDDSTTKYPSNKAVKTAIDAKGGGLELCDIGTALYVDETKGLRRYLNGQIVDINTNTQAFLDRLKEITTLHPSLLCTEEEWQSAKTMSAFGQVGKFVFNYADDGVTVVSVRIPRVVNVQGLFDLQNLGLTVAESLPNITGELGINAGDNTTGAFGFIRNAFGYTLNDNNNDYRTTFNASRSSSTYQDNAPVQQEAVQYPYFIQVATGSETENNIINDIELNNPYSLFDSKYSDHELNNLSWLKSEGQWNAKATYPTAYDKLLKVYNGTETVEGLSVKLSTETYTDYDFVLNTADETFRLPLLDGSESLPSETKIKQTFGTDFNLPYNAFVSVSAYSSDANSDGVLKVILPGDTVTHTIWQHDTGYNIYTSPLMPKGTKVITSGGTGYLGVGYHKAQGNGSLYYYVGETVQNANLIDAGRIGEQLATKTDILQASGAGMPSNKYIDLTLGASGSTYIAPANGYILFDQQLNSGMGMWVSIFDSNNNYLYGYATTSAVTSGTCITLPIKKNYKYTVNYTGGTKNRFRFIYAEGEQ